MTVCLFQHNLNAISLFFILLVNYEASRLKQQHFAPIEAQINIKPAQQTSKSYQVHS